MNYITVDNIIGTGKLKDSLHIALTYCEQIRPLQIGQIKSPAAYVFRIEAVYEFSSLSFATFRRMTVVFIEVFHIF